MGRILNFGSLNIDYVYSVPHIVRPGETLSAVRLDTFPGGKGLNQSVAMARAGAKVFHSGKIGRGGGFLKGILEENHVDCSLLMETGEANGSAIIQKDERGENSIICYPGSNGMISEREIEEVLERFGKDDILVSQNEISNVPYLIRKAGERGMKIAFNPSPVDESVLKMDMSFVTWLIINETEGFDLTGESTLNGITEQLIMRYPKMAVILTRGKDGSVYCDHETMVTQKAYIVKAKDTTAAGDTFLGYFLGTYVNDSSIEEALDRAAKAAAIAVTRDGAVPSIPYEKELLLF